MTSNITISSSWDTIKLVGKGGSSLVYKARFTDSGNIVAVKQIDTDGLSKDQIGGLKGEIETIKELHHPNIITYYGTQQTSNKIHIFLEYADRGSLHQFYRKKGPMKEHQVINCSRQILSGLQYLHGKGIAHRDIKCANCLLTQKGIVKLADFGASKRFESESLVSGLKGTPNWMSPEVIRGTQLTSGWLKADVWSLGCTMVEMLTANIPFVEYDNPMTAMYHIANGKAPSLQNIDCSDMMKDFIQICCSADPNTRPTVDQLLLHPLLHRKNDSMMINSPKRLVSITSPSKVTINSTESFSQSLLHSNQMDKSSLLSSTSIDEVTDMDEIVEEIVDIELENEYAQELFDEEESVEDETEIRDDNHDDEHHNHYHHYDGISILMDENKIIYAEENSMLSDSSVSILSEVGQSTVSKNFKLSLEPTTSSFTGGNWSQSGSLTDGSTSNSQSRKAFPRPPRVSLESSYNHHSKGLTTSMTSVASSSSSASTSPKLKPLTHSPSIPEKNRKSSSSLSSSTTTTATTTATTTSTIITTHYSLSAPTSRVTTASGSLESSPRAQGRRLASLSSDYSTETALGIRLMAEELKALELSTGMSAAAILSERPTAPLSGELYRIQNKLQDTLTLNSQALSDLGNGKKMSLPRSIPKDLSKSASTLSLVKKNSVSSMNSTTRSNESKQSTGISMSHSSSIKTLSQTQTSIQSHLHSQSQSQIQKPRRRVVSLAKERSRSAGVDISDQPENFVHGRESLPPVLPSVHGSVRSVTQFERLIQSAPPVARSVNLPPISPGKSESTNIGMNNDVNLNIESSS